MQNRKFPNPLSLPHTCPHRHLPVLTASSAQGITSAATRKSAIDREIKKCEFATDLNTLEYFITTTTTTFPMTVNTRTMVMKTTMRIFHACGMLTNLMSSSVCEAPSVSGSVVFINVFC